MEEQASCNVIYVDRGVSLDRCVRAGAIDLPEPEITSLETAHIAENVKLLLGVFGEVHLCSTGGACLTTWLELQDTSAVDLKPTLILIDTPYQERIPERPRSRTPSSHSPPDEDNENHEEELYGLALLQRVVSESQLRNMSKLAVPVSLVKFPVDAPDANDGTSDLRENRAPLRRMLQLCMNMGATDVMSNPMNGKCITNLEVHAFRSHREASQELKVALEALRGRKRPYDQEKPFPYLRGDMVANLALDICCNDADIESAVNQFTIGNAPPSIPLTRQAEIGKAIGQWHFCAHDFSSDELVYAAASMFKHAFLADEVKKWELSDDQLFTYVLACRAAYHDFVPYHNFRHVVDVLQATFHFLVRIGALPPYPSDSAPVDHSSKSHITGLLGPPEALTLLITAIGHDVGHPGVNNGFMVTLGAPLAKVYNDRSVLESFHCASYSQILRRFWPSVYNDSKMRNLMVSSILATDMGLHFEYMDKMRLLQEKMNNHGNGTEYSEGAIGEQRALACAFLIKCADISNVARKHETAQQWMHVLCEEFFRQFQMENELELQSSLMSEPKKEKLTLSKSQLNFMSTFAIPLFEGVADLIPNMQYCVDELMINKALFENFVAAELTKAAAEEERLSHLQDVGPSPKTLSFAVSPQPPTEAHPVRRELSPGSIRTQPSTERDAATQHTDTESTVRPSDAPEPSIAFRETNGLGSPFDAVADFARSDPFHMNNESQNQCPTRQRCSETTEGSAAPYAGDWASQATSATTGKMPLSPSTQGTSIISRDSLDRPNSVPVVVTAASESTTTVPESAKSQPELKINGTSLVANDRFTSDHNHVNGVRRDTEADAQARKTLKKKGSRFKINPLPFLRRHLSSSPPTHAADTAG